MTYRWMAAVAACMMIGTAGADELKTGVVGALGGAAGAAIGQSVGGKNGAVIGGAVGGATGAAVGNDGQGRTGAIVGGAVGGAAGAAVGQKAGGKTGAVVGAGVGAGAGSAIGEAVTKPSQPATRVAGTRYAGERRYYDDDEGDGRGCRGRKVGHHKHGNYNKHGC